MRELYKCLRCGSKFPIPRNPGKKRATGHIKTIWCVKCLKRTPHKNLR